MYILVRVGQSLSNFHFPKCRALECLEGCHGKKSMIVRGYGESKLKNVGGWDNGSGFCVSGE